MERVDDVDVDADSGDAADRGVDIVVSHDADNDADVGKGSNCPPHPRSPRTDDVGFHADSRERDWGSGLDLDTAVSDSDSKMLGWWQ